MKLNKLHESLTDNDLLDMPLHSFYVFEKNFCVYRVVGGWVYQMAGVNAQSVFVPEPLPEDDSYKTAVAFD